MPFRSYPTLKFSAEVFPFGETLVTTTFPRTSTRGFAAEGEPGVAVCLLLGTELAFEQDVQYDQGWIWASTASFRVAKFGVVEPKVPHRHHDTIEFPDGSNVLSPKASERLCCNCQLSIRYAALVAYSLHQPSAAPATGPLQNLVSPSFANPLVLLVVSMVIGALFGYASD